MPRSGPTPHLLFDRAPSFSSQRPFTTPKRRRKSPGKDAEGGRDLGRFVGLVAPAPQGVGEPVLYVATLCRRPGVLTNPPGSLRGMVLAPRPGHVRCHRRIRCPGAQHQEPGRIVGTSAGSAAPLCVRTGACASTHGLAVDRDLHLGEAKRDPRSIRTADQGQLRIRLLLRSGAQPYFDLDAIRVPYKTTTDEIERRMADKNGRRNTDAGFGRDRTKTYQHGGADPGNVVAVPQTYNQHKGVAHTAAMPEGLAEFFVKAASPVGGVVIDPFAGGGTTVVVARRLGRQSGGLEIHEEFVAEARRRIKEDIADDPAGLAIPAAG